MRERLRADYHWTPRQRQVLDLIAQGRSNPEIAAALDVSLQGAKWHVSEILDKLDAQSREEAADYWRRYNGMAPRFARTFRGLVASTAVKWIAGASVAGILGGATILSVAALRSEDDDPPPAAPTEGRVTPTPVPPTPTPTPEPPFAGTLAGIEVMAQTDDISPFEICPEVGLTALTVAEARALVAGDGPFAIDAAALPPGVEPHDTLAPDVFVCRGAPAQVSIPFRLEPGTPDVNPGGGSVNVYRSPGPPQVASIRPRSAWSELSVGSGAGIVLAPPVRFPAEGCTAAYWDEAAGVFTVVQAFTGQAPFCERMLRAIVEG